MDAGPLRKLGMSFGNLAEKEYGWASVTNEEPVPDGLVRMALDLPPGPTRGLQLGPLLRPMLSDWEDIKISLAAAEQRMVVEMIDAAIHDVSVGMGNLFAAATGEEATSQNRLVLQMVAKVANLFLQFADEFDKNSVETDAENYKLASWFDENTTVSGDSLRKAVADGKRLRSKGSKRKKRYSLHDAKAIWGNDIVKLA